MFYIGLLNKISKEIYFYWKSYSLSKINKINKIDNNYKRNTMLTNLTKNLLYKCSSIKVPVIDISAFLTESPSAKTDCKQVAEALAKYGCLIIKDPRVNQAQNDKFLDTL